MTASSPKAMVLVVDDEPDLCEVVAFDLNNAGFQVITATGGHAALNLLEQTPVDAIVSDLRMPDGDGVELLDAVKAKSISRPPVLLMTAYSDLSWEDAYSKGAEVVLPKPIAPDTLIAAVRRALTPASQRFLPKSQRLPGAVSIELYFPSFSHAVASGALSFGRGGVFVKLAEDRLPRPRMNAEFRSLFADGKSAHISGQGVVRWVRRASGDVPSGVGLEFLELDDDCREFVLSEMSSQRSPALIPKR